MRWACIHDKKPSIEGAPEACGKIAFYSTVEIVVGMPLRSKDFVMPDGAPIVAGSEVLCGGCGVTLDMRYATQVLSVRAEQ